MPVNDKQVERHEDALDPDIKDVKTDKNKQEDKQIRFHKDFAGESFCCGSPPPPERFHQKSSRPKFAYIALVIFLLFMLSLYFKLFLGKP